MICTIQNALSDAKRMRDIKVHKESRGSSGVRDYAETALISGKGTAKCSLH
jgi:hypothetical protein